MAIKVQALADLIAEFTHDVAPVPKITPPKVETPEKQGYDEDLTR